MRIPECRAWINYHMSLFPGWKYSAGSKEANAVAFHSYAKGF